MENIYFLYVLKSRIKVRHYIGISDNPIKRLGQHNSGSVRSTKPYRPWELVYQQSYSSKKEARQCEIFLKSTARARKELFDSIDGTGPVV